MVRLVVRAHPGASRTSAEWDGAVLHVRVTAHAVDGAANRAVIEAVAHALGVRRSAVSLVAGLRSREKVLDVSGFRQANLDRWLNNKVELADRAASPAAPTVTAQQLRRSRRGGGSLG
jgi:uncharacterized protein